MRSEKPGKTRLTVVHLNNLELVIYAACQCVWEFLIDQQMKKGAISNEKAPFKMI
jgi:hypothetical protein